MDQERQDFVEGEWGGVKIVFEVVVGGIGIDQEVLDEEMAIGSLKKISTILILEERVHEQGGERRAVIWRGPSSQEINIVPSGIASIHGRVG